jgi:hypothetical protein
MKKAMLQNAINEMDIFADIKRSEELDIAKGRNPIGYHDYTNLVQRVATNYDEKMAQGLRARPRYQRRVNEHHIIPIDDDCDYSLPGQSKYEANESIIGQVRDNFGSFSVNESYQQRGRARYRKPGSLRYAVWEKLSQEDRLQWDKLSDTAKELIVGHQDHGTDNIQDPRTSQREKRMEANVHEIEDQTHEEASSGFNDYLVQAAKSGGLGKVDVRQILSEKKKVSAAVPTPDDKKKSAMKVKMANCQYDVSLARPMELMPLLIVEQMAGSPGITFGLLLKQIGVLISMALMTTKSGI